ncbi:uncharacterized protein LOC124453897 [Xenia sp. Carnegie-2017]|uniref:uncharacterized protein LOC124453897 n=1 Tax=Xenia sp. Carnegie-2017 TaxID=2897299 RepID=UPI001F03C7EC|nr:uncharacterized protein LOC124453897 [Xenia sp. Carnegie-2017]
MNDWNMVLGTRVEGLAVVEIRICASPGRDYIDKDLGSNSKLNKHQDNEPSSTTDVTSSTTTLYPPRQSVLMSTVKDSSSPKLFQFSITQGQQPRKRLNPYVSDGFVVDLKWSQECADSSSSSDETFYLKVHGQRRYELLTKINEALHLLDGVKAPDQIPNKYASDERRPPEFTRIQPRNNDKEHEANLRQLQDRIRDEGKRSLQSETFNSLDDFVGDDDDENEVIMNTSGRQPLGAKSG